MSERYDVIVAGLGGMGSSAAYALARRGRRVLGIEQFTPAHALGSSHGATRVVRKAYFEKPDYVPLLVWSYQLWDELSAAAGSQLFTRCGALMMGPPDSEVVAGTLASARHWSLPHEVLDPAALRARYPQFELPAGQLAVFEADAGFALPEATVAANLELAAAAGAELRFSTVVEQLELGPDGVHLVAGGEELQADRVVIATGAWAGRLGGLDDFPITVQRQTVHWFRPLTSVADYAPEKFPVYMWSHPVAPGEPRMELYGFPYQPGDDGVKAALYHDWLETDVDPDTLRRTVSEPEYRTVRQLLARSLPGLAGDCVASSVCMYPGTPDDDFLLGIHPDSAGRVVLAMGFSGHGFKFVPVVGEIVADLVVDGTTRHDIGFLSPERYAVRR
ncbi:N-methyl-L-tryptophan oxidase [Jatrophihabitans sp.]|uniref:N-methyl-L-tryptophan oxidase n=1 Tax=Jatrophihabitans sp. TaxID=1932789 RepID=UPI002C12F90C|nr:N-methyl-L-tryptophan oxidase [Jatrophihabitans sp.]